MTRNAGAKKGGDHGTLGKRASTPLDARHYLNTTPIPWDQDLEGTAEYDQAESIIAHWILLTQDTIINDDCLIELTGPTARPMYRAATRPGLYTPSIWAGWDNGPTIGITDATGKDRVFPIGGTDLAITELKGDGTHFFDYLEYWFTGDPFTFTYDPQRKALRIYPY